MAMTTHRCSTLPGYKRIFVNPHGYWIQRIKVRGSETSWDVITHCPHCGVHLDEGTQGNAALGRAVERMVRL